MPGVVIDTAHRHVGSRARFELPSLPMSGQNTSISDSWRIPTPNRLARRGLIGIIAALIVGALLNAWINLLTWQRVLQLDQDFAAIRAERFYHSVHLRSGLRRLNDTLFRFHLKGDPHDLDQFHADSNRLRSWLDTRTAEAASALERATLLDLTAHYSSYLRETDALQKRRPTFVSARRQLDEINERLRLAAVPFFDSADQLMEIQRVGLTGFLQQSQQTLESFQRLTKLSLLLGSVLAVSLIGLIFPGLLAPRRAERSASQAAAAHQEKLAALGGLAAGVAHEIRNPLTAIKSRLSSIKRSLPAALANSEDANAIDHELHRLERLVKDCVQFARPSDPEWTLVPAARLFQDVHALVLPPLERLGIELRLDLPTPVWLQADPQQIKQVLVNLIQNAAESIGHDGVITLRAAPGHETVGGLCRPVTVVEVADTGPGILPEVQPRLFDPFFTTKDGGTGLGLPIAARIVEKHGGELRFETQLHRGTTFQLILPRVPEK
jgi:signal transduction histidine kinase